MPRRPRQAEGRELKSSGDGGVDSWDCGKYLGDGAI